MKTNDSRRFTTRMLIAMAAAILCLSDNSGVLAVAVVAVTVGLAANTRDDKVSIIPKLCRETSDILAVVLTWVVDRFAPVSIFCLLTRTFAVYGITYLEPALAYVLLTSAVV